MAVDKTDDQIPFWGVFGEFATRDKEPILVGIESDVRWGYDSDFDPWPNQNPFFLNNPQIQPRC